MFLIFTQYEEIAQNTKTKLVTFISTIYKKGKACQH